MFIGMERRLLSLCNHISHKPCLSKIASGLLLLDTTTSCKGSSNMKWEEPRSRIGKITYMPFF
ncbi:hypothetical protein HA466_0284950 [Hirschfeldia incana]|nr:hypothetical protein HA466_0284950 [Hirschfeldia incana]KAJ0233146.1 hypothetical protein HA466_0284950 [Hirschfeldia incana]